MKPKTDALLELARVVCSKQDVTSQEVNILQSCRSNAMREFYAGALVGGGLMWAAGWRFSNLMRITLSGAAAACAGSWRFGRSVDSSVNKILALHGSRMQKELAILIVKRHWNDPSMMQHIAKIFYEEKVFDDSTSDQPRLRWRYRNFFNDVSIFHRGSHYSDSHDSSHSNAQRDFDNMSKNNSRIVSHNDSDGRKNDLEHKQVNMNTGPDVMEDPLDCVFGSMTSMEEIHNPSTSSTPTRRDREGSHHRRRLHRHELHPEQHHA